MKLLSAIAILALSATIMNAKELPYLRADRASAVYAVGEEVVFTVRNPGKGLSYSVSDGTKEIASGALTAAPIKVRASAPGFLLASVQCGKDDKGKDLTAFAGAAIAPEKIRPGTRRPDDFDAYWNNQLKALRAAPMTSTETPLPADRLPQGFIGYDVTITRGDITATGYLVMPAHAAPKSLPAIMSFLGASKVSAELPGALSGAKNNAMCFNLNFHGLTNFIDRTAANLAPSKKLVSNYKFASADNREAYAMRKIFLRTVMVADYLMQRPEYDQKHLVAAGGSLGGCQALVCAALVPEVTFCVSLATAMCDHFGPKAGHLPGWPDLINKQPKAIANAPYFDVVNFAPRATCPVYMAVGFIDTTCPPATTYAAYNSLKTTEHAMAHTVTSGHGGRCLDPKDRGVFHFWNDKIKDHLKK